MLVSSPVDGKSPPPDYDLAERMALTRPAQVKAIGNPLRTTILGLLHERAATVTELAAALGRPKSTIAHHVKVLGQAGHERRWARTAHGQPEGSGSALGDRGGRVGPEDVPAGRAGHRTSDEPVGLPEGHVHRPVVARHLAELPGPVERVDDPHALGREAGRPVGALLAEDSVVGAHCP